MRFTWRHAIVVVAAMFVQFVSLDALADFEVLVTSGQNSPDGNGQFLELIEPTLNDSGQVAFAGILNGTSQPAVDTIGFYRRDTTGLVQIARTGDSFAGSAITGFFPGAGYLDSSGTVNGFARLGAGGSQPFYGNGGALTEMTPLGSSSPGGDNTLLAMTSSVTNDAGATVYKALYSGNNREQGVYLRSPDGSVETKLLAGNPVPGGGEFSNFGSNAALNENGSIGIAWDTSLGVDAVLRIDGSGMHELIREGDTLADGMTELGAVSNGIVINDTGQLAFAADYRQPDRSGKAIFLADDASTTLIAGGSLPDYPSRIDRADLFGLSHDGTASFRVEGTAFAAPDGIFQADASSAEMVVLEDLPTPDGENYFRRFTNGQIAANDVGQIAFAASIASEEGAFPDGSGLYFHDGTSELQEILRTGDAFQGDTVSDVVFLGSNVTTITMNDNSISGLNNQGQIAFKYILDNNTSGIAIWSPNAVSLTCDFDADGDCGLDDIAALFVAGNTSTADVQGWLAAASSPSNSLNPSGKTFVIGDVNLDGNVDSVDLGLLLNNLGAVGSLGWGQGNLNGDNTISSTDLGLLLNNFGFTSASTAAVPEPGCAALWGVIFFACILRQRTMARRTNNKEGCKAC